MTYCIVHQNAGKVNLMSGSANIISGPQLDAIHFPNMFSQHQVDSQDQAKIRIGGEELELVCPIPIYS
jgi:hypothetical protein